MKSAEEIKKLKEYYIKTLYANVRTEQEEDLKYINDEFEVPEIKDPHKPVRSGLGREMVDSPAEHIVTSKPQAFVHPLKLTESSTEACKRKAKIINSEWISILKRANPNKFKQSVKNKCARGENYIKLVHNESWVIPVKDKRGRDLLDDNGRPIFPKTGLPILFLVPDPMVMWGSPAEDDSGWLPDSGVPNFVIVFYERQPLDVILRYDGWTNPKDAGLGDNKSKLVQWFEYWDKNTRYFEADGEVVKHDDHLYGFTPFVRKYSGFGTTSHLGKLEELIVSDIKFVRGLLKEECIVHSNISSILTLFAHRPRTIVSPGAVPEEQVREQEFGAYSVAVFQNVPTGTEFKWEEVPAPTPEMFQYHRDTVARIQQRNPFVMAGFPLGSSGRQQIDAYTAAMKRYDTVIENTNLEWATAFEMAFRIMHNLPGFSIPQGLNKGDLTIPFKCEVRLEAPNEAAEALLKTTGSRLWNNGQGSISLRKFHTQYQGMTDDESDREIAQMMADAVTLYDPEVRAVWGMAAAKELGLEKWLEEVRTLNLQRQQETQTLRKMPTPTTQARTQGEFSEPLSDEEMDMMFASAETAPRGQRNPPMGYERNR